MEQHRGNLDERCNVTSNSHIVMIKQVRLKPTQDDQVLPIGRSLPSFGRTAQSKHVFHGTRPDTRLPKSRAGGQGQYLSY